MAVDFSGCIELTSGYYGFNYSPSGRINLHFDTTGDADEVLYGKDPTSATEITKSTFHIEQMTLSCGSSLARLLDGSNGEPILAAGCGSSGSGGYAYMNYGNDPLLCLTAETTESLCISSSDVAYWSLNIKGFWGIE